MVDGVLLVSISFQ